MLEATRFYGAFSHKRLCFGSKGAGGARGADIPLQGLEATGTAGPGLSLSELSPIALME